jgi:HSP20 family protein
MANITRFDPFDHLARFEPVRGLEDFFRAPWTRGAREERQIKIDVSEDHNGYRVKAEIPGVRKEDIDVSIDGNRVSISAEVKREKEERKGETVVRSERYYGTQFRGFTLQHAVDQSKAEAKYENGVLELTLPKRQPKSGKQISVL